MKEFFFRVVGGGLMGSHSFSAEGALADLKYLYPKLKFAGPARDSSGNPL